MPGIDRSHDTPTPVPASVGEWRGASGAAALHTHWVKCGSQQSLRPVFTGHPGTPEPFHTL